MWKWAVFAAVVLALGVSASARAAEPTPAVTAAPFAPPESLDEVPSAKREEVTHLLRKVRQRHGDDAVVIQTHLLLNSMQKGSVLTTGVRVEDHVEEVAGKRYLPFVLETGLVFDDSTRDRTQRAQILWATIMEPTLARLKNGLEVKAADGMVVQMQYFHRPYRSEDDLRTHIHDPGVSEEARFYVLSTDLDEVVRGNVTLRALLGKTRTTIDGGEVAITPPLDDALLTPGPE
jgi:hypothetical protein